MFVGNTVILAPPCLDAFARSGLFLCTYLLGANQKLTDIKNRLSTIRRFIKPLHQLNEHTIIAHMVINPNLFSVVGRYICERLFQARQNITRFNFFVI